MHKTQAKIADVCSTARFISLAAQV